MRPPPRPRGCYIASSCLPAGTGATSGQGWGVRAGFAGGCYNISCDSPRKSKKNRLRALFISLPRNNSLALFFSREHALHHFFPVLREHGRGSECRSCADYRHTFQAHKASLCQGSWMNVGTRALNLPHGDPWLAITNLCATCTAVLVGWDIGGCPCALSLLPRGAFWPRYRMYSQERKKMILAVLFKYALVFSRNMFFLRGVLGQVEEKKCSWWVGCWDRATPRLQPIL